MATVLVTGAAGFIGSHTCDQLLANGHAVVGIDNLRTGRRENLTSALRSPQFRLEIADLTQPGVLLRIASQQNIDAIIHLAALVSVAESVANPALNFALNVQLTDIVAGVVRERRIPRLVFASSAAVYGDPQSVPVSETAPTAPPSPYGAAKLASEVLLLSYARLHGTRTWCLRYFNVFGPRQDPRSPYSGVISVFADQLRAGVTSTIHGDGTQTRDFVSVHDVARANVIAATGDAPAGGVANICTGSGTTIRDLHALMRARFPHATAAVHAEARVGDIRMSVGSPEHAAANLNFRAAVSLRAGLDELLGY